MFAALAEQEVLKPESQNGLEVVVVRPRFAVCFFRFFFSLFFPAKDFLYRMIWGKGDTVLAPSLVKGTKTVKYDP